MLSKRRKCSVKGRWQNDPQVYNRFMEPRILVVDDDPALLRVLHIALSAAGFSVEETRTGRDALFAAASEAFDVFVVDLCLPDMHGLEVVRRLRTSTHVPIVVHTSHHDYTARTAAFGAGADAYLTKPFPIHQLVAQVRALLARDTTPDSVLTPTGSPAPAVPEGDAAEDEGVSTAPRSAVERAIRCVRSAQLRAASARRFGDAKGQSIEKAAGAARGRALGGSSIIVGRDVIERAQEVSQMRSEPPSTWRPPARARH